MLVLREFLPRDRIANVTTARDVLAERVRVVHDQHAVAQERESSSNRSKADRIDFVHEDPLDRPCSSLVGQ